MYGRYNANVGEVKMTKTLRPPFEIEIPRLRNCPVCRSTRLVTNGKDTRCKRCSWENKKEIKWNKNLKKK